MKKKIHVSKDCNCAKLNESEESAKKEKYRLDAVIDAIGDGISIQDTSFRVLYQNKAHKGFMGDRKGEFCYRAYENRNHVCVGCPVAMSFKDGKVHTVERIAYGKKGNRYFEITASPLKDASGKIVSGIESARDITGRKESEIEYKTILHTAIDGFYAVDTKGRILNVNESYCSMVGYSRDELLKMSIKDVEAVETKEKIAQRIRQIMEASEARFETKHKCKDGRIIELEASVKYIKEGNGKFFAFMRDITERKKAEEKLRESEARLSEAQKIARIGNWNWNVKTNGLYWSAENYQIFGIPPDVKPSVEEFMRYVHQDDKEFVSKAIDDALHKKKQYWIDMRIIRPDGAERIVNSRAVVIFDKSGKPERMTGTVQDVTERHNIEIELMKFKLGLERSSDAVFITDTEGNITYVNHAFENIYGYKKEEALGKTPRIIKSGMIPDAQYTRFWKTLLAKQTVAGEIINKRKDGSMVQIEGSNNPILDENGAITGFLAIHQDITKRKLADDALRRSEERFKQISENSEEWIWEVDKQGLYTYSSPIIEKILGYKPEELVGKKHFYDLFAPDIRKEFKNAALEGFARKESFMRFVNPNVHKDGRIRILETSGTPILDGKGNLLGYRGADRDITDSKQAEDERKKMNGELHAKVDELERFSRLTVGRELKMIELKKRIKELEDKLSGG